MSVRDSIVAGARRWMGTPYDWGGEGVDGEGVDCSGLVIAAYRDAGVPLSGRPIASMIGRMGSAITLSKALPGDVVYYDRPGPTDHVGIYIGNGQMIDSPTQGQTVGVRNVGTPTSIRRLVSGGGRGGGGSFGDANGNGTAWDDEFGGTAEEQFGASGSDVLASIFIPGYGVLSKSNDVVASEWAGEALAIGVKLVGTIAALGLVVAGVMHTVKNDKD